MDRIMVVDDDPTTLAITKALLSEKYQVTLMKSAMPALGYLQDNPAPDIFLIDFVMPSMSGIDMVKELNGWEKTKSAPKILMTAFSDLDLADEGYACGVSEFLLKPIIPVLLKMKVERALELVRLQKENQLLRSKVLSLGGNPDE